MKEQLDHIADTLKSMGYGALAVSKEPSAEYPEPLNRVYLNTGSPKIKAYLDVKESGPSFKVFSDFPEGHQTGRGTGAPLHGDLLVRHNRQQEAIVRQALTPAVAVAYMATTGGGDIDAARKAFGLDNGEDRYGIRQPKAEAETEHTAKAPAATLTPAQGM
jgi:hypothetical protein